jgi:hypothetical protein
VYTTEIGEPVFTEEEARAKIGTGPQCATARNIKLEQLEGRTIITYQFDPVLSWYPNAYPVDGCKSSDLKTIMASLVRTLNNTRHPNCKKSLFHEFVRNIVPGNAAVGDIIGDPAGTIANPQACEYTWPNEAENANRDGVGNPDPDGNELGTTALPTNCQIRPVWAPDGARKTLAVASYFLTLLFKHYQPKDDIIVSNLLKTMQSQYVEVVKKLENCPEE